MELIKQALDASLAPGTKKEKRSHLQYWDLFCSKFDVEKDKFGVNVNKVANIHERVRNEAHVLGGFAS